MSLLKARIQFYVALATLEEAGVTRVRALQTGMPYGFALPAKRLAQALQVDGISLSQAMQRMPALFSSFECNMVAVGEATGRIDTVCQALARWFDFVRSVQAKVINGLLYPLVVYHVAAVIIPFIGTITGGTTEAHAIRQGLVMLATPWLLLLFWKLFGRLILGLPGVAATLLEVPLLGGVLYRLDCARFFQAFSMGLNAGLGTFETVGLGAGACKNPSMANRFRGIAEAMRVDGLGFSQAFLARPSSRDRSSMIPAMMQTGEETGRSSEMAERIGRISREEAETSIERASRVIPTLIYLALAAYVGYQIVMIYGQYVNQIRELL